jgi:hypothetical protein
MAGAMRGGGATEIMGIRGGQAAKISAKISAKMSAKISAKI